MIEVKYGGSTCCRGSNCTEILPPDQVLASCEIELSFYPRGNNVRYPRLTYRLSTVEMNATFDFSWLGGWLGVLCNRSDLPSTPYLHIRLFPLSGETPKPEVESCTEDTPLACRGICTCICRTGISGTSSMHIFPFVKLALAS